MQKWILQPYLDSTIFLLMMFQQQIMGMIPVLPLTATDSEGPVL